MNQKNNYNYYDSVPNNWKKNYKLKSYALHFS